MEAPKERVEARRILGLWDMWQGWRSRLWRGWPWRSESGEVVTSKVHTMPEQWEKVRNWNNTIRCTVELLELLDREESEKEAAARLLQLRRQKRRASAERLVMGEIRERV